MKLKCAIFDFDGTLFDSMFIWDMVGEVYLRSIGKEPKPTMREDIRALSLYQSSCYFKKEYDIDSSVEEIMKVINNTVENFYINEVQPKAGVIDFLKQLKQRDIATCIATASEHYQIEAALRRCNMEHFFDYIFTCNEVGHGKDEPIIFRKAMDSFNANRENSIIFEDALHAVQTAKKDGFKVAVVFDRSEKRQIEIQQLADCYIADFRDMEMFWQFVLSE